jgi:hypothetical protein
MTGTPQQPPEQYGERLHLTDEEYAAQQERLVARNTAYEREIQGNKMGMGHWAEPTRAQRLTSLMYNNGIEIMQAPGYVVMRLEQVHETRLIPVDGRPPLDPAISHWLGESRGYWEGNTLVVETAKFNGKTGMTNVATTGAPRGNTPTSESMRIVERFTRADDDTLDYTISVEDPEMLTRPWTAAYPWRREPSYQFFEYACHEDNPAVRNFIVTSRCERAQAAKVRTTTAGD